MTVDADVPTHPSASGPGEDRSGTGARFAGLLDRLFQIEHGRFALWVPALFAGGIGVYFALPSEPPLPAAAALCIITLALRLTLRGTAVGLLLSGAVCCIALGFFTAKLRTELVAAPVLSADLEYARVSGWAANWEQRVDRKNRLTIRVSAIDGLPAAKTPETVRIVTYADTPPKIGSAIEVRAGLMPPPQPTAPGAFDFARMAYFMGLGAVGYAMSDIKMVRDGPAPPLTLRFHAAIEQVRAAVGGRVDAALSGPEAGIAKALINGDRGGIPEQAKEAMRASGLAHVLAISGLHMAIMAGSIYWVCRLLLVLIPGLALRIAVKKWAAAAALAGGLGYLLISGAPVATQRAYIMAAVLLVAIMLDRPALTLRNVLVAAMLILALTPESLLDISFQMSFAAATALIATYEQLRGSRYAARLRARMAGGDSMASRGIFAGIRFGGGIALTTMVAGLAVAPIAAYHFHTATSYSLIGNLLAMPVVGLWVMPAALAALVAMPANLSGWPLAVMGAGVDVVLAIAAKVSALPGAVRAIEAFPLTALVLIAVGALWLAIWRGRWRYLGLMAVGGGLLLTGANSKPDILVDRDGKLVAVRTPEGRLAAVPGRAGSYSLDKWLAADGDARPPGAARSPDRFTCDAQGCVATVKGLRLSIAQEVAALEQDCRLADIVVTPLPLRAGCPQPRLVITRERLSKGGAHAIYIMSRPDGEAGLRVIAAADRRGHRPWTGSQQ
jgi:competence protein ComEC